MPVNPKKLIHHTITIPVGDDSINIQFRRPSLAKLDEIRAALKSSGKVKEDGTSNDDTFSAQVEYHLFPHIVSWDMVGDDGEPLPVTLDTLLNDIPSEITLEMLRGVSMEQTKDRDAGNAPTTP
jgi:hypothetical protein